MTVKRSRLVAGFVLLVFLFSLTLTMPAFAAKRLTIGVSIRSLSEERWARERELMAKKAEELGVDIIFTDANNDEFVQNSQIENLIARGIDALIIIARNSDVAAIGVDMASKEGIPSIAYDVAIYHPDAIYVSFDSVRVGYEMAKAVVEQVPKGRYFWIGGSPTDDNAYLVRKGHFQVLQPLIDSGDIELLGEQWCDAWSPEEALKHVENALTAHANRIDAVVCSNDGTAGGAVQALKEQGLAGKVPTCGQDADLVACQRIAEGTQTVTIFKDVRILADAAVYAAVELAQGKRPAGINGKYVNEQKGIEQDAIFVEVIPVTQKNLYEVIVKGGFHKLEDVYRNVPKDEWPKG
ncbi:MAG: substrate-binding domain-containing protein [Firmicutes bacterium]|nr:substrate-binding domain-containing protein [Bacillota bacterium]HXL04994.1 substrate-binding domain-containing protein [Bacillota bacterium]